MSFPLDAMQRLLLWRLAFAEEGEFLKDISTSLSAAKRQALVREGYIAEGKKSHPKTGRSATYLTLEDKGWGWCQEHLRDELQTRSTQTTPILERLLGLMANYFEAQDQTSSLGQFVLQARRRSPRPSGAEENCEVGEMNGSLEEMIRDACLELGRGQRNVRVRLADLRQKLDAPRTVLDQTLLEMERQGELSLFPLDDPQEIGAADREAVLKTVTGNERHIVYFSGR
jgi:hypothetical protein